ncbi:reverse transcriptase N-terminal domain-containing protein [Actinoplanes lobatus]|uniref:Reverse transcriptase N-terminal domain-containing protein n=2 Tax=Actinoplanes lobatus TaxID=113568 RepID=A0A7W7HKV0_9ACTN|nr:reverse transcriptase N-terminal domain-containing protein [Actinoplanes lobatus]MBB4752398.1 hypothetical protein [Actinoplanes lobatus]
MAYEPEGVLDWHAIDWRAREDQVRRTRQRILTTSRAQDTCGSGMHRSMLQFRSNTLLAVRRVTGADAGRLAAGVDGRIVPDDQDKAVLARG